MLNKRCFEQKGGQSTLRPVTIKQIIGADQPHPDADFQIDGADVGSVSPKPPLRQGLHIKTLSNDYAGAGRRSGTEYQQDSDQRFIHDRRRDRRDLCPSLARHSG